MILDAIYNKDCLDGMKEIPDRSIDLILCDLPYGTTACKWDTVIPFEQLWEHYNRITKDTAAIVLFGSEPFSTHLRMSNIAQFKYDWIWEKTTAGGFVHAKNAPMKKHEIISVFSRASIGHKNLLGERRMNYEPFEAKTVGTKQVKQKPETLGARPKQDGKKYEAMTGFPTSILKYKNETGYHPTQKPVPLLEFLIMTYTCTGVVILDNCFGSGSTLIAAVNTERHYVGFELEQKYFEIAQRRLCEVAFSIKRENP